MSAPVSTGDGFEAPPSNEKAPLIPEAWCPADDFSVGTQHHDADLYPDLSPSSAEPTATTPTEPKVIQLTDEERKEMTEELDKVEGEIATLRQVLGSKVRYASELKRKLGITPLQEMKTDFQHGIQTIRESTTYQRTNEKLHDINERIHQSSAYQKTSAVAKSAAERTSNVVSAVGSTVSRKLGDLRNSTTFKSVEGKVESAYATVKSKVSGSKSEGNFEEALLQDKENNSNGSAATATEAVPDKSPQ